jgi:hypothetical protein
MRVEKQKSVGDVSRMVIAVLSRWHQLAEAQ